MEELIWLKGSYYPKQSKILMSSLSNYPWYFFQKTRTNHPKIYMGSQKTQICQSKLRKKKKSWRHNLKFSYYKVCTHTKSLQSCLTLCDPWPVAWQAPLAMGFFRQQFWSGVPCPPPAGLPGPGIEPSMVLEFHAGTGKFFTTKAAVIKTS